MKGEELIRKTLLGEGLEKVPIGVHSVWPAAEKAVILSASVVSTVKRWLKLRLLFKRNIQRISCI